MKPRASQQLEGTLNGRPRGAPNWPALYESGRDDLWRARAVTGGVQGTCGRVVARTFRAPPSRRDSEWGLDSDRIRVRRTRMAASIHVVRAMTRTGRASATCRARASALANHAFTHPSLLSVQASLILFETLCDINKNLKNSRARNSSTHY